MILRMLFSQRHGYKPVKSVGQRESMDDDLRNKLWSVLQIGFFENADKYNWIKDFPELEHVLIRLWFDFFKRPLDDLDHHWPTTKRHVRTWFFKAAWCEVLDFVEFWTQQVRDARRRETLTGIANHVLEAELSAYRFVDDRLVELTSESELATIETALKDTTPLKGVNEHLRTALALWADRKKPDHRNSIKESISAVESLTRLIAASPKATLGDALKRLKDRGVSLHPALEKSWSALYGWTNDEQGIRHALIDEPNVGAAEARYMFVSCSAFINYLLELSERAGLSLEA